MENSMHFADDTEKMIDFYALTKEEFLSSYSYLTEEEYNATVIYVDERLMMALEYMTKQLNKNKLNYKREYNRGVPDEMLNNINAKISYYEESIKALRFVRKNSKYFEAVEMCPHCGSECAYPMWDVNKNGFVVECLHCGKEILLCDECMHHEDGLNEHCNGCDWHVTDCGGECFRGAIRD